MAEWFIWPRGAQAEDCAALEGWLAEHGWEVDPTVFMAGALGQAAQVRRIDGACQEGEPGLLILPGETVEYDGMRVRLAAKPAGCLTGASSGQQAVGGGL
ncbi:hypothetical protein EDD96_6809 [Streptomyces sp. Ag109_G2-6]|uniref:hypothetical protein n=1 Tax=Streptomyces TaxID=1883 RepID=UPI0009A51165|nr:MULTISPECIES: hypothetical protein [Streptomyces]RPF30216.1 hypothetical protein EDD96_6809 [Streptomyces sp. Ag109_G2-6]